MASQLADELLQRDVIDTGSIEAVRRSPSLRGRSFAARLYQSGLVDPDRVFEVLTELGARDATAELTTLPQPRVLALVPSRLAEDGCLVPLQRVGSRLLVAMLDPSDQRAIEDVSLFTGLVLEPYVARARDLFRALFEAYGVPMPSRLSSFVVDQALDTSVLPPPRDLTLPAVSIRDPDHNPVDDVLEWEDPPHSDIFSTSAFGTSDKSPLEASLTGLDPDSVLTPAEGNAAPAVSPQTETPADGAVLSTAGAAADPRPTPIAAATPGAYLSSGESPERVPGWSSTAGDQAQAAGWQPGASAEELQRARGAVASQVLPMLTPAFSHVALFLVRDDVAVGWDGAGPNLSGERIRDVLLPLTPPSTLRLAVTTRTPATGDPDKLDSIDRILLGFLGAPSPAQWSVLPLFGGTGVVGLLYADSDRGPFSEEQRELIDAAASTLSDSLHAIVEHYGRLS